MDSENKKRAYRRLDNVEEVEDFASLLERSKLNKNLDADHPYCIFSIALSDEENGFLNRSGLGLNIADFRRGAEEVDMPLVLVVPFYNWFSRAEIKKGELQFKHEETSLEDSGFNVMDSLLLKTDQDNIELTLLEKKLGSTTIIAIQDKNFGEYGTNSPDQSLYQAVVLGFGGYEGLKFTGLKPSVIQLTDSISCFAGLARLDELVSEGMNFYEAMVYTRKHTVLTTNVAIDNSQFSRQQIMRYVLPNLKSDEVKKWLLRNFQDDGFNLRALAKELSELKMTSQVELTRESKIWQQLNSGVDLKYWSHKGAYEMLKDGILDDFNLRDDGASERIDIITAEQLRAIKDKARARLNMQLNNYRDQNGKPIALANDSILVTMPACMEQGDGLKLLFADPERLGNILDEHNAHLLISGQIRQNDQEKIDTFRDILKIVSDNPVLKRRVHYIVGEDENLLKHLLAGANVCLSLGTVADNNLNWMRALCNLDILVAMTDNDMIDAHDDACLVVVGADFEEKRESLYNQFEVALAACPNDFDLEYWAHHGLDEFVGVISATRMVKDYLKCVF